MFGIDDGPILRVDTPSSINYGSITLNLLSCISTNK